MDVQDTQDGNTNSAEKIESFRSLALGFHLEEYKEPKPSWEQAGKCLVF